MFKKAKFNLGDKVVITNNLLNRLEELCFYENEAKEVIGHYGMITSVWHELDDETGEVAYNVMMEGHALGGNYLTFYFTEDCLALETEANNTPVNVELDVEYVDEDDSKSKNNMLFRELAEILAFTTTIVLLDEKGNKIGTLEVREFESPLAQDFVEFLNDRVVLEVCRGNGEYEIEVRLADV